MKYRYLVYPIDKRKSSPTFRNDLPAYVMTDVADGLNIPFDEVIIDLVEKKRYFAGVWTPVDCSD